MGRLLGRFSKYYLRWSWYSRYSPYDLDTEVYNKPYITKLPLEGEVVLVKKYVEEN